MANQTGFVSTLLLPLLLLAIFTEVEGAENSNGNVKLFVFGDSYVDTGNFLYSPSFMPPSGITFPGQPAGRFSDGRVLTDYVASSLDISSPTPYRLISYSNLQYGINFAYGGTGIFNTLVDAPNMAAQIDLFEKLIQQKVYTEQDLDSSVALVSAAGNDYVNFFSKGGSLVTMPSFTLSLINQMTVNLRRIHSLGVKKVAVGLLQPLGCLPIQSVASLYQNCIEASNLASINHNNLLLQSVQHLNSEVGESAFVTLDLYNSFLSTIATMQKSRAENPTLMNPLEPCYKGVSLCEKPGLSFFWDILHPSQNGWGAVYMQLESVLHRLKEKMF